VLVGPESV